MADTDVLTHRSKKLGMENCKPEVYPNNDRYGMLHFHTLIWVYILHVLANLLNRKYNAIIFR